MKWDLLVRIIVAWLLTAAVFWGNGYRQGVKVTVTAAKFNSRVDFCPNPPPCGCHNLVEWRFQ